MGKLPKATKRRDLISRFRELDWTGPHKGVGRHPEYMAKGSRVVKIPNPHSKGSDIGEGLLKSILEQADISQDLWIGEQEET